ncbi:MAG: hypothetical protein V4617_15925 [Gemmatimonadota bacterium]
MKHLAQPRYLPHSWQHAEEAQLDQHGKDLLGADQLPHPNLWDDLAGWWLKYRRGANTPNWDLACGCEIGGTPGLVLVEAKAHEAELDPRGKSLGSDASDNSRANHANIGAALTEAGRGLAAHAPGISLSVDNSYQLSNRLAFGWWLAAHKVPVVLVYLGFTGDTGMRGGFTSADEWNTCVERYFARVKAEALVSRSVIIDGTPLWTIARSREVLSVSPVGRDATLVS